MAQAPSIASVHYGAWTKIAQAPVDTAQWMHFPRAISFDVLSGSSIIKKTLLNWQTNRDAVQFPMSHGWAGSVNEAGTFNSPSPISTGGTGDLDMMVCTRRNTDGVMIAIPFYFNNTSTFSYYTSADNGATWTKHTNGASVTGFPAGQVVTSMRFHRGVIQDADGTLYAPMYAAWKNTDGTYQVHRSMLMKSTDGGVTWSYLSTIQYTSGLDYNETTIARCKDNSILAIMRNGSNGLKYKRSTDNGATWGSVNFVPNIPANVGVDPYLQLLPNGVMVLSYGDDGVTYDRNCLIAYDPSGNGSSWTSIATTFTGTTGLGNRSSGYTSTFALRNNQFMQISDRALYTYYGSTQHPTPNPFSIWSKKIDVVTNYRNRIDLKTKYPAGDIAVTTDMTYTDAAHPEAGIAGAFDASTDYWSGAFKMANSGSYTIDLKDTAIINGISISLLKGLQQSATIDCSLDGTNWTTLKTYTNVIHNTVDYTAFSPLSVRYVRASVTGSIGKVGINEFNIFRTADTFEDYAYGIVPEGYTSSAGFWMSEATPGYKSKRMLYMTDQDSGADKEITKTATASATKTLVFKFNPITFSGAGYIQFRLMSGTTNVFRIGISAAGIKYYNGSSYVNISSATVALNTWKKIKIVADAPHDTAAVYVNGVYIGKAHRETTTATSMSGILFSSAGAAAVGDVALFDDVDFFTTAAGLIEDNRPDMMQGMAAPLINQDDANTGAMSVMASPNPADAVVKLTVKNIKQGKLDFYIANAYGKNVKKFTAMSEGETFSTDVSIQDLPVGVYVITVQQNGMITQTKLVK